MKKLLAVLIILLAWRMAEAQEIQRYGNTVAYHRPVITVAVTNLSGAGAGGDVNAPATFDVLPGSSTNIVLTASNGFYAADVTTNGLSVGGQLTGRYSASATFALKAGECVRRLLFVIFAPDSRQESSPLSGRKST